MKAIDLICGLVLTFTLGFEIGTIYTINHCPPVLITHSVCEPTSKFYLDMDKG